MKTYKPVLTDSILAAEDIASNLFVNFAGELCGANEKSYGVSELPVDSGEMASVIVEGIALVIAGDVVSIGDAVKSDADGKAVTATAVTATVPTGATGVTSSGAQPTLVVAGAVLPDSINGYALDAAAEAGDLIRVKLV
ncbi:MAG: DUF2190 family protein [Ignavibacteriaceae bacterium]|nr:DUF2190 family protein [Ignavibacteriaceae bacterium]